MLSYSYAFLSIFDSFIFIALLSSLFGIFSNPHRIYFSKKQYTSLNIYILLLKPFFYELELEIACKLCLVAQMTLYFFSSCLKS